MSRSPSSASSPSSSSFLSSRSFRSIVALVTGASFLFACASEATTGTKRKRTPVEPGDEFYEEELPTEEGLSPTSNPDSGAFSPAGERPSSGTKDGGSPRVDGGAADGGAGPKVYCTGALGAGDLAVTELMISSRSGSGDDGEWIEITSTRDCWLRVKGLAVESPRGSSAPNAVTISEDFELAPGATFIVADSADPLKNGGLAGKVFAWEATDVLKNDGDTVSLKLGSTVIDTVTYPAFSNLSAGRTLAFPDDCAWNVRSDWARWSLAFTEYKAGKKGTPNATNGDVACY